MRHPAAKRTRTEGPAGDDVEMADAPPPDFVALLEEVFPSVFPPVEPPVGMSFSSLLSLRVLTPCSVLAPKVEIPAEDLPEGPTPRTKKSRKGKGKAPERRVPVRQLLQPSALAERTGYPSLAKGPLARVPSSYPVLDLMPPVTTHSLATPQRHPHPAISLVDLPTSNFINGLILVRLVPSSTCPRAHPPFYRSAKDASPARTRAFFAKARRPLRSVYSSVSVPNAGTAITQTAGPARTSTAGLSWTRP